MDCQNVPGICTRVHERKSRNMPAFSADRPQTCLETMLADLGVVRARRQRRFRQHRLASNRLPRQRYFRRAYWISSTVPCGSLARSSYSKFKDWPVKSRDWDWEWKSHTILLLGLNIATYCLIMHIRQCYVRGRPRIQLEYSLGPHVINFTCRFLKSHHVLK